MLFAVNNDDVEILRMLIAAGADLLRHRQVLTCALPLLHRRVVVPWSRQWCELRAGHRR
jgi:hypothetical protein